MKKSKTYLKTKFDPVVFKKAEKILMGYLKDNESRFSSTILRVRVGDISWTHDSEDEFFADYRKEELLSFNFERNEGSRALEVYWFAYGDTTVNVNADSRAKIEAVFEVFEEHYEASKLPEPKKDIISPTIFIGHGHDGQWLKLKDHLHEQHEYDVEAYEIGARAGHEIRDVLEEMASKSTFAILVMTGEDETVSGEFHPRLNVVHELGLFQGRLSFSRAIVLLEEGVAKFSNINGVQQIRFDKGRIKETFGDVLATLRREFGVPPPPPLLKPESPS